MLLSLSACSPEQTADLCAVDVLLALIACDELRRARNVSRSDLLLYVLFKGNK